MGQSNNGDTKGFIRVIAGRFRSGCLTGRSRKPHLHSVKHLVLEVRNSQPDNPIMTFGESNRTLHTLHDDPLVIELKVSISIVKRVLVNCRSSADIITLECLKNLRYSERDVTPLNQPVVGFGGNYVHPVGSIKLPTWMGEKGKGKIPLIDFLVVDILYCYG